MADILEIPGFITTQDIDTASMLHAIADEEPENAFVIVWPKDGTRPTFHSNTSDMPHVLFHLQEFIHDYYREAYDANNQ